MKTALPVTLVRAWCALRRRIGYQAGAVADAWHVLVHGARQHEEAVAVVADLELERIARDMLEDADRELERADVARLVDAGLADGTIPASLEPTARGWSLSTLRSYLDTVHGLRRPSSPASAPVAREPSLEDLVGPVARALGAAPAVYLAALLGPAAGGRTRA